MQHARAYQDMQAERGWFENVARYCCPWWHTAHQRDHAAFFASFDEEASVAGAAGAARLPGRVGDGLFAGSSVFELMRASSSVISLHAAPGLS